MRTRSSRSRATWACILLALLLVAGCSATGEANPPSKGPTPPPTPTEVVEGRGGVAVGRTQVRDASGDALLRISPPELTTEARESLSDWGDFPIAVGEPVTIEAPEGIPAAGVVITRTYDAPLPDGAAATLGYYDGDLGSWRAVPSQLADDRMSVSATVDHLSPWTDFVGGAQDAMARVGTSVSGGWAYHYVGSVLDTRVAAPECTRDRPAWVDDVVHTVTDRNSSVLYCVGLDSKRPELVTVKARVNRGFGFRAHVQGDPAWTYNSTLGPIDFGTVVDWVADIDQVAADLLRRSAADGRMVGPGEEFSLGMTEAEVRTSPGNLVLRMEPEAADSYILTTLAQLMVLDEVTRLDGYVGAALALSTCSRDLSKAQDTGGISRALISCISGADEDVARHFAVYLADRGRKDAGRLAGKLVGKASIHLALVGPTSNTINYVAERFVGDGAHTVHIYPTIRSQPRTACFDPVASSGVLQKAGVMIPPQSLSVTCAGDWALLESPQTPGDTAMLVRRVDGEWEFYTGFPSGICRDEYTADSGPDDFVERFFPC